MDIFEDDPLDQEALAALLGPVSGPGERVDLEGPGVSKELYRRIFKTEPSPSGSGGDIIDLEGPGIRQRPRTDIELPSPKVEPTLSPEAKKLKAIVAKMPMRPETSRALLDKLRNAPPVKPQMRASTPEERLLDSMDENDPAKAQIEMQIRMRGPMPPAGPTAMRAPTRKEKSDQAIRDLRTSFKRLWQPDAAEVANTTVPAPLFQTFDPMMGSAAPEAMGGKVAKELAEPVEQVLAKVLKTKKAPKLPPFAFAPVDETALARQAMLKADAPVAYKTLPKDARPTSVHRAILENGGVTVQPATGQMVEIGKPGPTMVGQFPNSSKRTLAIPKEKFTQADVRKFYDTNRDVFAKDPKAFVGGWVDEKTNTVYLDVSKGFDTTRAATKHGELQNPGAVRGKPTGVVREPDQTWPKAQEAVFEPESMTSPPVGNSAEFIGGPEFQARMDAMASVGRRAMGDANPAWWDLRGGPIERVYGKENLAPMAGYTATMSPQNGPVDDLQMATEFMRRQIKGEPVRQPGYRVPATAMGKRPKAEGGGGFTPRPGAKFPNEKFYAVNAERVRAGKPETVTQDKVNDMFHALMGENTGVYDRHWAKLAEAPERGIYTHAEKNVIEPSMTSGNVENYPLIQNAVRDAAKRNGMDESNYSAHVWEGIRQTIRETGELFGQKHAKNAVPATTTGFNEIFEGLLAAKAKHLGVTVPKLEEMLRNGNAELLTVLLATPIGAAAYQQWRARQQPSPSTGGT